MAFVYNDYEEPESVKRLREEYEKNKTYNEAQSVIDSRNALAGLKAPEAYQSQYADKVNGIVSGIENRKPFQYDVNGDALYQQYKNQYINLGRQAMMDTMGQAATLTGGYGNSYAATVGNQAYQGYLSKLNDVVPELYQLAYSRYQDEGNDMYNRLNLYNTLEQSDYGRYRDALSDYNTERAYLSDAYNNERSFDYGKWNDAYNIAQNAYNAESDRAYTMYNDAYTRANNAYEQQVAEDQWNRTFEQAKLEADREYQLAVDQFNWQKEQAALKGSSGGGSSGGGSRSGSKLTGGKDTSVSIPNVSTYEDAAAFLNEHGIDGDGGLMTKHEWLQRKSAGSNSAEMQYSDYESYLKAFLDYKING